MGLMVFQALAVKATRELTQARTAEKKKHYELTRFQTMLLSNWKMVLAPSNDARADSLEMEPPSGTAGRVVRAD